MQGTHRLVGAILPASFDSGARRDAVHAISLLGRQSVRKGRGLHEVGQGERPESASICALRGIRLPGELNAKGRAAEVGTARSLAWSAAP